ncbi:MAG: hypothetical protein K6D94_05620, partial [Clostridiales bacterium]|nr:hypothetical protein [Clostridiales bacterium]
RAVIFTAALILGLFSAGCGEPAGRFSYMDKELVGIGYEYVNGMIKGEDFMILISPDQVISARYWSPLTQRYTEKSNRSVSPARWNKIAGAVVSIAGRLVETPPRDAVESEPEVFATDGPQKKAFWLYWRDGGGVTACVRYYEPSEPEFEEILSMLKSAARHTGKKMPPKELPTNEDHE